MEHARGILLSSGHIVRSLVSMPPTAVCRLRRRCHAGVPHRVRRSPPPDACGGPVRRRCPRRFRRAGRGRGPRVTWAGMARSPRRLPRRPADSPALPLQHTQRDSRPLMFRHDYSGAPIKRARLLSSCCCCFCCSDDGDPRHSEPRSNSKRISGLSRTKKGETKTSPSAEKTALLIARAVVLRNTRSCRILCESRKEVED